MRQFGAAVLLVSKDSPWRIFTGGLNSFTNDVFEDGREQGLQEESAYGPKIR